MRLSVVIPALGEGERLLDTLGSLAHLEAEEIVVAAHGEDAATRCAAQAMAGVTWVECPAASRGAQLARGAQAATGEALLFLHADTRLPRGAGAAILKALADPTVVGGAFRLAFDARHPALALLARMSALPWRFAYMGDQGLFCRRAALRRAGGVRALPLFEDVDLALRLARQGRLVRLPIAAVTSARRFAAHGPWRQLALNAVLLGRYHAGASPEALARRYRA